MLVKDVVIEDAAVVFCGGKGEDAEQSDHELLLLIEDHDVLRVLGRVDEAAAAYVRPRSRPAGDSGGGGYR